MDGAFKKAARDMSLHANKSKRLSSEGVPGPSSEPKIEVVVKRQKISDSLEAGDESTKPSIDTDKDHPETPVPAKDSNEAADHDVHGHPARESVSNTEENPMEKSTPDVPPHGRETRSSRRSLPATHDLCDDDDDEDPNPQPALGGECKRWEKPLVYPRFGKKKAEVDAQDLERLRDNEFLNDNLIGFYIRFLEDHLDRTNKEAAKKVYFFNSYFYATLTNKRPINYESVQKWTRTVDIFSHDYVVIPINEAAHWYVAIICNLPNLESDSEEPGPDKALPTDEQKEPPAQVEAEIQAIPGTPEPSQEVVRGPEEGEGDQRPDAEPVKEEITRQSMAAMTLGDKEVPASADEEWPEKEENPPASPACFSSPPKTRVAQQKGQKNTPGSKTSPRKPKKQKKKPRDHLDPRDPREPVIITFDSLDFPRALTTRNLRQYLAAEAKSKKGTDIITSRMAGIRARNIPFQNNSSDCGLYMLAYLEKFVQDPDTFVSRLLQGQMSVGADWPPLSSGPLRLRLRQFLDDLYDEQGQLGSDKASEKPPMADKKPISFLLPELEPNSQQNTNTINPEAAETQAKPSSPQPTIEPSEPSAAPPPPSEATKSPEVEAQLSTAGPLKTPDSPDRNLRHRRNNNDPGPPKAVRSAAALFGRFNQRTESRADRDIVEVPDSQEHDPHAHPMITDLSSPTKLKNPDETDVRAPVSASKLDKRGKDDVVTVEDDDPSAPAPAPASESDPAVVEVQIKETPPPELKSTKENH